MASKNPLVVDIAAFDKPDVDISQLPPPPQTNAVKQPSVDISDLPPPPPGSPEQGSGGEAGTSLPEPPANIAALPPPWGTKADTNKSYYLTPDETAGIAQKYGVDPAKLNSIAPYMGIETISDENPIVHGLKGVAGEIGSTVGLNAPQYAYKHLALSEGERRALDDMRELSDSRKNGLQKTTEFARGFAMPTVGIPRVLGKTAPAALKFGERLAGSTAVGAAAGALNAPEGQEKEGAIQGAKWGAILHTGLEGVGLVSKVVGRSEPKSPVPEKTLPDIEKGVDEVAARTGESEKIAADAMARTLDTDEIPRLSDDQVEVITKQQFPDIPVPDRNMAEQFVENRIKGYAHEVSGSRPEGLADATDLLQKELVRGPEYLKERYTDYMRGQMAEQAGAQINKQRGFWGQAGNYFSDSQYVLRDIDTRTGTRTEPILNEMNKDYNKSTYKLSDWRGKMDQIYNQNKKIVDGDTLFQEMKAGQVPKEHQKAADRVSQFFDQFHQFQISREGEVLPLGTRKLENYLPEYAKSTAEIIPMVEKRLELTRKEAGTNNLSTLSPQEFQTITSQGPGKELLEFANWGRQGEPIQDGAELEKVLDHSLNSDRGKQNLELIAKSSLERTGGTPDFLLEKNVYKLMSMYTGNTIRAMYLRRGIDKLRAQMQNLERAGADKDAGYVRTLIQDIQGIRPGTAAAANRAMKSGYYKFIDRLIDQAGGRDTVTGSGLTAVRALPEVLRELSLQIYPAAMGLNIRSVIQNSTSAVTKLAPELGGAYGYKTTLKAAAKSLINFREQMAQVKAQGFVPEGFVRNGEAAIAEGLQSSALYQIPKKALDGMSKALMALHQTTEAMNRVLTKNVGEIMGRELAAGSSSARAALNRFPSTIQKAAQKIGNDPEALGALFAKHLNDTTQYNYNRMSMNQFGRSFGPMFSVFTKWPAATAGDIIATFREKGAMKGLARNVEKYIAPAMLLHATSMALLGHGALTAQDDLSDRQKQWAGSQGLVQGAPIGNILSLVRGETGMPPAAALAYHGVIEPLATGKGITSESAQRTAGQFVSSFTPGVGILRFLTQDLVTYITNHKPEGDFFEKTAEGSRRLNKLIENR